MSGFPALHLHLTLNCLLSSAFQAHTLGSPKASRSVLLEADRGENRSATGRSGNLMTRFAFSGLVN